MWRDEREGDALKESSYPTPPSAVEDAPDPEEDDLDDLDGMSPLITACGVLVLSRIARYARRVLRSGDQCAHSGPY